MNRQESLSIRVMTALAIVALAGGCAQSVGEQPEKVVGSQEDKEWNMKTWHHVTVGVADLDEAMTLWVDQMGFEVFERHEGSDVNLANLWSLPDNAIERQAMLRTPKTDGGYLHLVQFKNPDAPVRQDAKVFDLVPKNLDIHAHDLPQRVEELRAAGRSFRTDSHSELTAPSGTQFREIHMLGHDDTNIVLLEVIGEEHPYTPQGYAGVGPLISIVPDATAEQTFYEKVLGLEELANNLLSGPEIERMVGLPPGSGLDVRIVGAKGKEFGLMELVEYQGVEGENRYPRAKPPALGTLHVAYYLNDLQPLVDRLMENMVVFELSSNVETWLGEGDVVVFQTPAGLRIEAHHRL